ncbi:MAG TPA: hypothetical protein VKF32_11410 [Thermoanaerobaculia bacterium]|nr:hypothetical protein [Thermoanaerobaculia bacterium]
MRWRRRFVAAIWAAFVVRGTLHALMAPIWDGFDEPFHVAYVLFVADHGRPPGWTEPSFPEAILAAVPALPTFVKERRPALPRWSEAPGFQEWRAMEPEERARRRASASGPAAWRPYGGANYERQQAPLFYLLSAPGALLFRRASLPGLVVALRIWCVLLASLAVPLVARFLRLALPWRGVVFGLPLLLLPNTLFFVFRVTNDALAFALTPALALALLLVARRPTPRRALALGLLAAAGLWTKLTLAPALPAALVAVLLARRRRDGRRAAIAGGALVVPVVLALPLFVWNRLASGSWTGLVEATQVSAGPGAYVSALLHLDFAFWARLWTKTHLWAGGWAFLQPSGRVFAALLAALAAALAALALVGRARVLARLRRSAPVLAFALLFVCAMAFHAASMAVTGAALGTGPGAGGEGWYFDLLRPVEALVVAALVDAAVPLGATAFVAGAELALFLGLDALGVLTCLVPFWSGKAPGIALSIRDLGAALDVGPLAYPHALAAALAAGVVAAALAATVAARRAAS